VRRLNWGDSGWVKSGWWRGWETVSAASTAHLAWRQVADIAGIAAPATGMASTLVDDGTYTFDPTTNLDWLDLSQTINLSYDLVANNQGVNFIAQGWHFATEAELATFYFDGTGVAEGETPSIASYVSFLNLLGLTTFENTSTTDSLGYGSIGYYGTPDQNGAVPAIEMFLTLNKVGQPIASTFTLFTTLPSVIPGGLRGGALLVRDAQVAATPLPGSLNLFASGLGLIGLLGWRRARSNGVAVSASRHYA
jgi:hypothetical protein